MRPEKTEIVREIKEQLDKSSYALLVDCRGLTVEKLTDLRGQLQKVKSRLQVVRNAFLGIAAKESGLPAMDSMLSGPTSLVTGTGDVTEVAKVIQGYISANGIVTIKGGVLDRMPLSAGDVNALAKIPARPILLGKLVGTVAAPMSQLVGVMRQKVASVVYVLKAVEQKKAGAQS